MSLQRSILIGGPAKIFTGAVAFWTPDVLKVRLDPNTNELKPTLFGRSGEAVNDLVLQVSSFTPFGLWQNLTTLFPAYYLTPTIGARLFGNADVAWKVWSNNQDMLTITAGAVMKPPTITLSTDGPIMGPMSISGVVGNGLDPSSANSYYLLQSAQADPGGSFATTTYKQQLYTAAWGAVTGFGSFQAQDKWTIELTPKLEPVKVQGWTYDYKLVDISVTAKCIPVGPTSAQIYAAIEESAAGARLGDKGLGTLTITGADGATSITLNNMALKNRGYAYGAKELRSDELTWVNASVPGTLMALT